MIAADEFRGFGSMATRLIENGYLPVPLVKGQKKPFLSDWVKYRFMAGDEQRFADRGTGIICGAQVGVDVDVRDPTIAAQIRTVFEDLLGLAPARIGNAPKVLLLYGVQGESFSKMSSAEYVLPGDDASAPGYKPHKIEILAEGQQFVAFNDHPDTGKPYFWNGAGDPLCVPVGLLPSANRADFAAALEEAERVLARRGTKFCATPNHDSGGVHKPHGDPRASDPAILRAALRAIPNAGADYDFWKRMCYATKAAIGEDGRDAWLEWSGKSGRWGADTDESIRIWDAADPNGNIGAGFIYFQAGQHGWARSGPTPTADVAPTDAAFKWDSPGDLWSVVPPVAMLPRGILPATIESYAFSKTELFQPAALAAAALTACAIATTDFVRLVINPTWRESFRIWTALQGPSSASKSPIIKLALQPIIAEQELQFEEHRKATEHWELLKASAKKADEPFSDPRPVCIRYLANGATLEALQERLKTNEHGIGLVHDELSSLIAAMDGAYKEKSANERGSWLKLYDGGAHFEDRIGRGEIFVKNFSCSVLGGVTTDKLLGIVGNSVADGLLSRIGLIHLPAATPSADLEPIPLEAYRQYETLVRRLLKNRTTKHWDVDLEDSGRRALGDAKLRWMAEAAIYAEKLPRFSERLGKLTGVAARVGLGFALIEAAEFAGGVSGAAFREFDFPLIVTADQMARACQYVNYQARHDFAFYATAAGQSGLGPIEHARDVASWLLQVEARSFQFGEITRHVNGWRSLKPMEKLAALELLDQLGWIRPSDDTFFRGTQFIRGITWAVNPAVHEEFAARAEAARKAASEAKRRLHENVGAQVA